MERDRIQIAGSSHDEVFGADAERSSCGTATTTPTAIDLCCGLGGLSLAARQLGIAVVAGVDIGGDAVRTFSKNFPAALDSLNRRSRLL